MLDVLDLGIRVLVLLAVAGGGVALLRRRSASLRASIWTAALAAALLLPAISTTVPALRLAIWPAATTATPAGLPPQDATIHASPAAAVNVQPEPVTAVVNSIPDVTAPAFSSDTNTSDMMAAIFAVVTFGLIARIAANYRQMRRIAATARPAAPEWIELVDQTRAELGITSRVAVRATDATSVPAIAGLLKPVLLLPADTADWSAEVRRIVVVHELAHVARRDAMSQLLGQLACAVYWFVPLAWYGAWRAGTLRERASDDVVLQTGVRPSAYAGSLVSLAQSTSGAAHCAASLEMARPSRIYERVTAILNPCARRDALTWQSASAVVAMTFLATAGVGAIQLVEQEPATVRTASALMAPPSPAEASTAASASTPSSATKTGTTTSVKNTAAAAPVQASDRLCGGRGLDHSSSSIQEDDNKRRLTVKLSGDGCTVDLRAEGRFEFNADFTDIARIPAGGYFRIDVNERGVRRQLEIEPGNGGLVRTWRVDGREQSYDAAARAWFAQFLIELDRRTAIGVDVRLPLLIRQGGVDAVLKETALMISDYARHQYYTKLPKATKVTPAEAARVVKQASTMNTSDYYSSELIRAYVPAGLQDPASRAALMDLVERMKSDYYQSESIIAIIGPGAAGSAEMDAMLRLVPRMSSDHYKMVVLMHVFKGREPLNATQRQGLAKAAASIGSDFNAAEVLQGLARAGVSEDAVRRSFFDALATLESDHYHSEVLETFLKRQDLSERDLIDALASSKSIGSDHYRAQALERIARHASVNERVRTAVLDATSSLSKTYADQVRRAAGR